MTDSEQPFELRGLNHLALVSSDMARTVDFYEGVLGLPLIKTIDIPGGGQHFFFSVGGNASLAFFWFPNAPAVAPGVSQPAPGGGVSGIGSMNHVAFDVAPEMIEEYRDRLRARGIDCTEVVNHDDSERQVSKEFHPGVFVRSIYFNDPDGFRLEFAAWTRALTADDVRHAPATADGTRRTAVGAPA